MAPTWTFHLCDAQGFALAELSTALGRSISYKRNTFSEASFTIGHEDTAASLLLGALANTGIPTLRCYRKPDATSPGVLRFAGYLAAIQEAADESALLTATFRSPFGRLYGNGNDMGRYISTLTTFTATDAGAIARSLIDTTNLDSPTRLVAGMVEATKTRDRTYPVGTNVGDAIFNLTNVLDGFDFYETFVGAAAAPPLLPTLPNPSFDVDASGWTATNPGGFVATITRYTGNFDSAPAAGRLHWAGTNVTLTTTFSGTFQRGVIYRVTVRALRPVDPRTPSLTVGVPGDTSSVAMPATAPEWDTFSVTWVPRLDSTGVTLTIDTSTLGGNDMDVDTVTVTTLDSGTLDSTLNIVASQGVDNPAARFEYGPGTLANVQHVSRETQPPANCIFVVGGNGLTSTYTDAASVTRYGKWYAKAEYSDVTEQATLDDKARAMARPYPVRTVTFTPEPALAPNPFDDYGLGDTVRFYARRGALVEDTPLRLNAFTVLVDDEGNEAAEIQDPTSPEDDALLRASLTAEVLSAPAAP